MSIPIAFCRNPALTTMAAKALLKIIILQRKRFCAHPQDNLRQRLEGPGAAGKLTAVRCKPSVYVNY